MATKKGKTPHIPRNPEGGWLPPVPSEFRKWVDKLHEEARTLWGVDEDNDRVVRVMVINYSDTEYFHFMPIPDRIIDNPHHPLGKAKWSEGHRDPETKKYVRPIHTPEEEAMRNFILAKNEEDRFRTIMGNLKTAQEELERYMRVWEHEKKKSEPDLSNDEYSRVYKAAYEWMQKLEEEEYSRLAKEDRDR